MALLRGVGAEQPEAPLGEGAPRCPGLLAIEEPAAVDLGGLRAQRRKVGPGVGLAPSLAPDLLPRGHRREEPTLLLWRAEIEDRGREQEDAVLADPLWPSSSVVLLLEEEPLDDPDVAPPELLWPRHHAPVVGEHRRLEGTVLLEPFLGVERCQAARWRDMLGEPGSGLRTEALLVVVQGQIHPGNLTHHQIPRNVPSFATPSA